MAFADRARVSWSYGFRPGSDNRDQKPAKAKAYPCQRLGYPKGHFRTDRLLHCLLGVLCVGLWKVIRTFKIARFALDIYIDSLRGALTMRRWRADMSRPFRVHRGSAKSSDLIERSSSTGIYSHRFKSFRGAQVPPRLPPWPTPIRLAQIRKGRHGKPPVKFGAALKWEIASRKNSAAPLNGMVWPTRLA